MVDKSVPDYELLPSLELTDPSQVQAIGHSLRTTLLGLLHERAATITEMATAVDRPKSTVAYHVGVLLETGLVRVVRTRRVRAIEERFFGRTARMFYVGIGRSSGDVSLPQDFNDLEVSARESAAAYSQNRLRAFIRHARIPNSQASEFWKQALELINEFDLLPRSGDTTHGFVIGLYPIPDYPSLPDNEE